MTREQAKREIDDIDFYLQHHTDDYSERSHDAMMMAIQALSQEQISLNDINNALGASFRNGVRSAKVEQDAISRETIEDIKADIEAIEINGQVDEHTMFIRSGEQVKQMTLDIIDKYTKGE